MSSEIWLITGAQASGKSTVAELLAHRFVHGVHVRGGQFYRWVARGWVHFDDETQRAEARRLLDLRYRLSAIVAAEYAGAGFTAIVQDNIYGDDVSRWLGRVAPHRTHLVVLRPRVEIIEARHEARRLKTGKTAFRGAYTPVQNDTDVARTPRHLGLWLDTSDQTPDETVAAILAIRESSIVSPTA
jgi:cytidylate kinase